MIGWAIRQVAIWGGLTIAVYLAVGYRAAWLPSSTAVTKPHLAALPQAAPPQGALALQRSVPTDTLVYRANPQGHVILDAVVNGVPVHFLVDTGASFVALTMQDAAAAGIAPHQLQFTGRIDTANGQTRVAPVRLREVRIGQLAVEDVAGVVHEHLSVSLLGQTFLNRLRSYEMRDGVLTITW